MSEVKSPWVLVLAGGSGTRFWPASRRDRPKHLLPLLPGGRSLLHATVDRAAKITTRDQILVVTAQDQADAVRVDLGDAVPPDNIIAEPVPRNTAPAIALAMVHLGLRGVGPHDPVVVLPSDHGIRDEEAWAAAVHRGVQAAVQHKTIVTLGVEPSHPSTGFGYLGLGGETETDGGDAPVRDVLQFKEKPQAAVAREYFDSGNWWWNGGVFIFRLGYLWYVMGDLREDIDVAMQVLSACIQQDDPAALAEEYAKLESISIDYAVMEQAPSVMAVELNAGWSDLGSWDAVAPLLSAVEGGVGEADSFVAVDAHYNAVYAPGKTVALVGVSDLVVVATDDAILVVPRNRAQEVREVVAHLRAREQEDLL